ncbi:MAG: hypothetical protein ACJ8FY_21535 [Gemmataceae bacterium]
MTGSESVTLERLTTAVLGRACRLFLTLAYPDGPGTIPPQKKVYFDPPAEQPLQDLLKPPVCAVLHYRGGTLRGYALRLGSATYPHIKLQVVHHEALGPCVFSVDTHDELDLDPDHPDAEGWARLQTANRQLKERIERAWEAEGLLTFNGLLRRELGRTT